eukprot:6861889-Prymnesium_polylepis.1
MMPSATTSKPAANECTSKCDIRHPWSNVERSRRPHIVYSEAVEKAKTQLQARLKYLCARLASALAHPQARLAVHPSNRASFV